MRPIVRRTLLALLLPLLAPAALRAQTADRQEPVEQLPGFDARELPQFVAVTFDDNFRVDGMEWVNAFFAPLENPEGKGVSNNYDGTPVRTTFFHNSTYLYECAEVWGEGFADGHEVANHTDSHPNGREEGFDVAAWSEQIELCTRELTGSLELEARDILGFRTPYLAYNDATFVALAQGGVEYDSSLQGCWGLLQDGSNCLWPYTLDEPSPDNLALAVRFGEPRVERHPGLWEVPVSTLIVPPDSLAERYDFEAGLRARIPTDMGATSYYERRTGKLAPLDVTLFYDAELEPREVLAILKYTFDLHYEGNRAPFVFVAHTHVYSTSYDGVDGKVKGTAAERRAAIEDFVTYALGRAATRMRPVRDIVEWMRHPRSLEGEGPRPDGGGGANHDGGGGAPGPDDDSSGEGCGCRLAGSASSPVGGAASVLGVALVFFRRLRRSATRVSVEGR